MQDGCTPLIVHSERGNNSVVMELCKQGALVNAQDKVSVVTNTDYSYPHAATTTKTDLSICEQKFVFLYPSHPSVTVAD